MGPRLKRRHTRVGRCAISKPGAKYEAALAEPASRNCHDFAIICIVNFPKPTSELLHRLNRAVASPRLKFAAILMADLLGLRHLIVRLDPVNGCNMRCGMCFFSDPDWRAEHMKGRFSKEEIERLAAMFFGGALQVHIGCAMEPTMFRDYPWLVETAKKYRVPFVGFTTNGQMLSRSGFERMVVAGLDEITLSTHGVVQQTYETLMDGGDYDRLHATLGMIDSVRRRAKAPRLRINYTICPDNLEELSGFFEVFGRYEIATVQLRPIADFGNTVYANKDMVPHIDRYNAVIAKMIDDCRERGITLLANRMDPAHKKPNLAAMVYQEGLLRYLNPNIVWREDFDWRAADYRHHKRQIVWRRQLLRHLLGRKWETAPPSHQAVFEVL
jgi:molybdenum cofactor biosynthesis enzyme MoaA